MHFGSWTVTRTIIAPGYGTFNIVVFRNWNHLVGFESELYLNPNPEPCNRNRIRIQIRKHNGFVAYPINFHPYPKVRVGHQLDPPYICIQCLRPLHPLVVKHPGGHHHGHGVCGVMHPMSSSPAPLPPLVVKHSGEHHREHGLCVCVLGSTWIHSLSPPKGANGVPDQLNYSTTARYYTASSFGLFFVSYFCNHFFSCYMVCLSGMGKKCRTVPPEGVFNQCALKCSQNPSHGALGKDQGGTGRVQL